MALTYVEVFVGLLIATIPLVGLARRWHVPYPIVLVLGGLVLGSLPWLPPVTLNPDLVLLIFLPPLLYWESVTAPTDEMAASARWIWPLAIGLVIVTIAAVAMVTHALLPTIGWAAAVVLGATIAPTDEIASIPIVERLGIGRHVVAIIDGESLFNDAGSLVIYAAAIAAVVTGTFSWVHASEEFVLAAVGAFAIGVAAAALAVLAWRQFTDTRLQAVISVLLPFVAYVPAQQLGVSGVLAVITAGVVANRYTPVVMTPPARLQLVGWWETTVFLMNAVIFILVGLSLRSVVASSLARGHSWGQLLAVALAVNVTLIAVRFAWIYVQGALRFSEGPHQPRLDWKHRIVIALCGFRGAVSLAAALAIPITTATHMAFPERDLIVFVTFSVIVVTLVGGGLALPSALRALNIPPDDSEEDEVRHALTSATQAAVRTVDRMVREGRIDAKQGDELRERYVSRLREVAAGDADKEARILARYAVERELIAAQRETLLELRKQGEIENMVLRRLQLTLDMEQTEIERYTGDLQGASGEDTELDTEPPQPPASG